MPLDSTGTVDTYILPTHAGSWWRGHEAELHNALLVANRAAPHLAHLAQMLLPRLPRRVLASSSIKGMAEHASSRIMPLAEALTHQWVAFNGRDYINTEAADFDEALTWRTSLAGMVDQHGMAAPAVMVASPHRGTVHLLWIYDAPISRRSEAAMRLRRGIRRGLVMLGGCPRFANCLQKNPWHIGEQGKDPDDGASCGDPEIWHRYRAEGTGLTYHTEVMSLGTVRARDLFAPLAAEATRRKVTLLERRTEERVARHIPLGNVEEAWRKGTRLFQMSARAVRRACTGNPVRIHGIVAQVAAAISSPATAADISGISASISDWMNSRWRGPLDGQTRGFRGRLCRPVDVGVMKGEAADRGPEGLAAWRQLGLKGKRQAAAARTNGARTRRVDEAIREAVVALLQSGEVITQAAVASRAGTSISSVQRRWQSLRIEAGTQGLGNTSDGLIRLCGTSPSQDVEPLSAPSPARPASPIGDLAQGVRASQRHARLMERPVIRRYRAQAARLLRRGAQPEDVLPPPRESSASVRAAHGHVLEAQRDLRRRIAGRHGRERQRANAEERAAWHAAHIGNEEAFIDRLKRIGEARDDAVRAAGNNSERVRRIELHFASIFGAEYRARRRALGEPERVGGSSARPALGPSFHPKQGSAGRVPRRRDQHAAPGASTYTIPAVFRPDLLRGWMQGLKDQATEAERLAFTFSRYLQERVNAVS